MEIKTYTFLHRDASAIRREVFIIEQGFPYDYDETDEIAVHFVLYNADTPVGVCRVFKKEDSFVLGRLAVLKPYRGNGYGKALVVFACEYTRQEKGQMLMLHSQMHSVEFYEKLGFKTFGEVENEAGAPHIWMKKNV